MLGAIAGAEVESTLVSGAGLDDTTTLHAWERKKEKKKFQGNIHQWLCVKRRTIASYL